MAKLSKTQRKLIGEAVRQIVANLGLVSPVKKEDQHQAIGEPRSQTDPKYDRPKTSEGIVSELFTVGISGLLFSIFAAGIINFLGQFPQILNFGAWGISVLLVFGAGKLVCCHSRHWAVLLIAIITAAAICVPTWYFVKNRNSEDALAKSERREERQVITNEPTRFSSLDAGLSNIASVQQEDKYSGELIPANDLMPNFRGKPVMIVPTNCTLLFAGGSLFEVVGANSCIIVQLNEDKLLSISYDGVKAFVSGKFFDRNGKIIVVLEKNRFDADQPNIFRIQRPDKSTLIIRDHENIEVLNIRFLNERAFALTGTIRLPNGFKLVIDKSFIQSPLGKTTRDFMYNGRAAFMF
jgi:hypothetical protein